MKVVKCNGNRNKTSNWLWSGVKMGRPLEKGGLDHEWRIGDDGLQKQGKHFRKRILSAEI